MKRFIALILVIIFVLTLFSCGSALTEGEVYEKEFRPAHSETRLITTFISTGKTFIPINTPYIVTYPDRWVIHIKSFDGEKWLTEDFYVSEELYNSINIGDMFVYDESRGDLQEEPYTKEKESEDGQNQKT